MKDSGVSYADHIGSNPDVSPPLMLFPAVELYSETSVEVNSVQPHDNAVIKG